MVPAGREDGRARASEIKYLGKDGREEYAWTTSWGVSTRLVGALVMAHSDDDGLVLPPRLAPRHVVVIPIYRGDEEREQVLRECRALVAELRELPYDEGRVEVELDDRDLRGGEKAWYHIKRGVPVRVEIGPRDLQAGVVTIARRDRAPDERQAIPRAEFVRRATGILDDMQRSLYERARTLLDANTREISDRRAFDEWFDGESSSEGSGGFALAPFVDDPSIIEPLAALKISVRCIPLEQERRPAKCLFTGKDTDRWAIFARAY